MKINIDGKEVEAYHLIMRKENALEILKGTKKIEVREFKAKYEKLFVDKQKEKEVFEAKDKDPNAEFSFDDIMRDDVKYIFFTNYSKSWSLVVELDHITAFELSEADITFLKEEFDFHDLDQAIEDFKDVPEGEKPLMFGLVLGEIKNRENI